MSVLESYQMLGLESNVTFEVVKAAHRRLIKRCHPDLYHNNKSAALHAVEEAKRINAALDEIKKHLSKVIAEGQKVQSKQKKHEWQNSYFHADQNQQAEFSEVTAGKSMLIKNALHSASNFICSKSYLLGGLFAVYLCAVKLKQFTAGEVLDLNVLSGLFNGVIPF